MKISIVVNDYPDEPRTIEVDAHKTATPGLVIHGYIVPGTFAPQKRGAWVITHALSGWCLSTRSFPRLKDALDVARALGDGIDWTREHEDLRADEQVRISVVAAYTRMPAL